MNQNERSIKNYKIKEKEDRSWNMAYFAISMALGIIIIFNNYKKYIFIRNAINPKVFLPCTLCIFLIFILLIYKIEVKNKINIKKSIFKIFYRNNNKENNYLIKIPTRIYSLILCGIAFGSLVSVIRIERVISNGNVNCSECIKDANISGNVKNIVQINRHAVRLYIDNLIIDNNSYKDGSFFCYKGCDNIEIGSKISFIGNTSAIYYREYSAKTNYLTNLLIKPNVRGSVGKNIKIISKSKFSFFNSIYKVRRFIINRIVNSTGDTRGKGLIVAITTGNSNFIYKEDLENMRSSGLAHLIAISGLHISIITSFIFIIIRKSLTKTKWCLILNTKKIAASVAIIFGIIYTLLANTPISAVRSLLMFSIAMLAIIIDRRPMPLRIWSIVCITMLTVNPEKLFMASFQMSFLATFALIVGFSRVRLKLISKLEPALYYEQNKLINTEVVKTERLKNITYKISNKAKIIILTFLAKVGLKKLHISIFDNKTGNKIIQKSNNILSYVKQVTFSSLLVAIFLSFIENHHFGYVSLAGIVTNFIAIPIIEFVILPISLISIIFSNTGIDSALYAITSYPSNAILKIADLANKIPISRIHIDGITPTAFGLIILGLIIISRLNRRNVFAGIIILTTSTFYLKSQSPILLFEVKNNMVVYKENDKYYWFGKKNKYQISMIESRIGKNLNSLTDFVKNNSIANEVRGKNIYQFNCYNIINKVKNKKYASEPSKKEKNVLRKIKKNNKDKTKKKKYKKAKFYNKSKKVPKSNKIYAVCIYKYGEIKISIPMKFNYTSDDKLLLQKADYDLIKEIKEGNLLSKVVINAPNIYKKIKIEENELLNKDFKKNTHTGAKYIKKHNFVKEIYKIPTMEHNLDFIQIVNSRDGTIRVQKFFKYKTCPL